MEKYLESSLLWTELKTLPNEWPENSSFLFTFWGLYRIESRIPQGNVLGPILYLLHPADLPTTPDATIATYARYAAILALFADPVIAHQNLQASLSKIQE